MALKTLPCREHGGTFQVAPRRGRPPVRCSDDNVCSRYGKPARATEPITQAERTATSKVVRSASKAPESVSKPRSEPSASLLKAQSAKEALQAQGWTVDGKAKGSDATLTCSRGEETLFLTFRDGALAEQNYLLWNVDKPSANGMPKHKLTFDPDEMTDTELIRALNGMKVTWWNRLASNTEMGIVSGNRIQIEHSFAGNGDETPADRIVKFIDHGGAGFRAFRVGALLKVG